MRRRAKQWIGGLAAACAACVAGGDASHGATVTAQNGHNAVAYVNPFAASTKTGGPYASNGSAAVDGTYNYARQQGPADSSAAHWQFVRTGGAATFQSMLTFQYHYALFDNASPYHIKLGGATVLSGPATPGLKDWRFESFAPVNTDTLRIEFENMAHMTGTWYADMMEVMAFEERLEIINATHAGDSGFYYTAEGTIPKALTLSYTGNDGGWFPAAQTAPNTRYFDLSLGGTKDVAVVLMHIEPRLSNVSSIDLQLWTGSAWETFATVSGFAAQEYVTVYLPDGVSTDMLRFDAGEGPNGNALAHVVLLGFAAPLPEPGLASLILLIGIPALRKR
jgi:hypothetical protein